MRVLFRADANVLQGSGHVMRCLTLAEELTARGHDVTFLSSIVGIDWLVAHLAERHISIFATDADSLDPAEIMEHRPDWVVVDSYLIKADDISNLASEVHVLAIVDGDTRGIRAQLLLDQNLGAELDFGGVPGMLAGADYALIRDEILRERRLDSATLRDPARVLAFMGGTDPIAAIVPVAAHLARLDRLFELTIIAPERLHDEVQSALAGRRAVVLGPTPELPRMLGKSDVVVSAAGTSAWDLCTLGIPSVLLAVADNQLASLRRVATRELGLTIDLVESPGDIAAVGAAVNRLLGDRQLRTRLVVRCMAAFDGLGKVRVANAMLGAAKL